jgi:uncharacterized membrane protein YdbT with pleckstrin-like domain
MRQFMKEGNVLYLAKLHWLLFLWPSILLCSGFILGIELIQLKEVALLLIGIALIWLLMTWITYHYSSLMIKPTQISLHTGMLIRKTVDIPVTKIETVDIRQTIVGSIFNYGSLMITGTGGTRHLIDLLDKPLTCRRYIEQLMSER